MEWKQGQAYTVVVAMSVAEKEKGGVSYLQLSRKKPHTISVTDQLVYNGEVGFGCCQCVLKAPGNPHNDKVIHVHVTHVDPDHPYNNKDKTKTEPKKQGTPMPGGNSGKVIVRRRKEAQPDRLGLSRAVCENPIRSGPGKRITDPKELKRITDELNARIAAKIGMK